MIRDRHSIKSVYPICLITSKRRQHRHPRTFQVSAICLIGRTTCLPWVLKTPRRPPGARFNYDLLAFLVFLKNLYSARVLLIEEV